MSTTNLLPRSTRRSDYVAAPGQTVFGPPAWLGFDTTDIRVRTRLTVDQPWATIETGFTISLTASPVGYPVVTFAVGQAAGLLVRVEGRRVHPRTTDVTRAGALLTAPLERELDMQAAVLQELRRDVDEGLARLDLFAIDLADARDARDEAVAARNSIRELYLGDFNFFPESVDVGFAIVEGALVFIVDQPDPEDDGMYVRRGGVWLPVGVQPAAFERVEDVFVDAGMVASGVVAVPGGYVPGVGIQATRNGVWLKPGASPGLGALDPDYTVADGATAVFPATYLVLNDWLRFYIKRPYAIATLAAADVLFTPAGGLAATNVQAALVEVAADRDVAIAAAVAALVNSSPATLDTLKELADAIGSDPNFATTIANALALKAPLASPAFTGAPTAPTPTFGDNTTKIATMAALQAGLAGAGAVGLQLIASGSNPGAMLDFALGTTYRRFLLKLRKFEPVTNGAFLKALIATDGVPTYLTTANYSFSGTVVEVGSATISAWQSTASEFQLSPGQIAAAGNTANFDIEIENSGPSAYGSLLWRARVRTSAGSVHRQTQAGGEFVGVSSRWTHLRLAFSAGNIAASAEYALYGFKE